NALPPALRTTDPAACKRELLDGLRQPFRGSSASVDYAFVTFAGEPRDVTRKHSAGATAVLRGPGHSPGGPGWADALDAPAPRPAPPNRPPHGSREPCMTLECGGRPAQLMRHQRQQPAECQQPRRGGVDNVPVILKPPSHQVARLVRVIVHSHPVNHHPTR